jgi:hypothetical protein
MGTPAVGSAAPARISLAQAEYDHVAPGAITVHMADFAGGAVEIVAAVCGGDALPTTADLVTRAATVVDAGCVDALSALANRAAEAVAAVAAVRPVAAALPAGADPVAHAVAAVVAKRSVADAAALWVADLAAGAPAGGVAARLIADAMPTTADQVLGAVTVGTTAPGPVARAPPDRAEPTAGAVVVVRTGGIDAQPVLANCDVVERAVAAVVAPRPVADA